MSCDGNDEEWCCCLHGDGLPTAIYSSIHTDTYIYRYMHTLEKERESCIHTIHSFDGTTTTTHLWGLRVHNIFVALVRHSLTY